MKETVSGCFFSEHSVCWRGRKTLYSIQVVLYAIGPQSSMHLIPHYRLCHWPLCS